MQDDGGNPLAALLRLREEGVELGRRHRAAEPAKAGEEDQLQLGDDGACHADEQIVEAPVLEVILDPGAPDPADPAVHDDHLAVVDVPERANVPASGSAIA